MIRICEACGQKNRIPPERLTGQVRCGRCKENFSAPRVPIDADALLFDEIVSGARVPVLVDFWAEWCGPCRMAAPEVAAVAADMAGRTLVLKVDTDRHPDVAARFGVRGIPNFVVLKSGQAVHQQAGVVPKAEMIRWLTAAGAP